jgi:hypothetical protein
MDTHYLPPHKLKFCRKDGALLLKMDGQQLKLDTPKRAAPLSNPDEFIVLSDREGNEIGVLRRLSEVEPASREVLQHALEAEYRVTMITRLLDVEREPLSGHITWRVEIKSQGEEDGSASLMQTSHGLPWKLGRRATPDKTNSDKTNSDKAEAGEDVVTVHHEKTFAIAGAEDVQTSRYPRIFITDVDGNRYEIENCEELDIASRRMGEKYF